MKRGSKAPVVQNLDRKSLTESINEAENAPLKFNPEERAALIRSTIDKIRELKISGVDDQQIFTEFSQFAEQYPRIFKCILAGEDTTTLVSMLALMDKMSTGSITQHQASVIVGKELANKYIKPIIQ
jgi:hypothetical protein